MRPVEEARFSFEWRRWGFFRAIAGCTRRRRRRIVILFRNAERLRDGGVALDAEHTPRDVLANGGALLEPLGISAGGNPYVRHARVLVDDEVAARGRLVVTGVRLRDGGVREQRETTGDE